MTKGSRVGKTSWRRLPGEKPNWLRPSVPLMYEEAQGRESHLKSRIAHVGRDLSANPTAKDWRGNTGGATPFNRGEVASDRGAPVLGGFPSRGGDTHAAEDLCVQDI